MGYYRYRLKCNECGDEWNSFFCSVDMTSGANHCTKCGSKETTRLRDDWKDNNGKWMMDGLLEW